MRVILAASLACACQPLQEGTLCARACAADCATSCLPSGYCLDVALTQDAAKVHPAAELLRVTLPGLPPSVLVTLSLHVVLDLADRGKTLPWDYSIVLRRGDPLLDYPILFEEAGYNAVDFPIAGDWSGLSVTSAEGVAELPISFTQCTGRGAGGCILLPGSSVTARLIDAEPWRAPPQCQ